MARLFAFLLWTCVFFVLLLLIDQFLVRVPLQQPALAATQRFYRDFRQRLFALGEQVPTPTIEGLIEQARREPGSAKPVPSVAPTSGPAKSVKPAATPASVPASAPRAKQPNSGFVYADERGELHMVERLELVPERYRASAQPLSR